ncbi:futalosine hydrolase [Seinonella peptonophila]|uniref:Futalosine hydrolase n=1 Tax=Seinonella peptonophila TaxID=112248 RepID=A0A1M4Z6Y3_9BACL|nr:futalosine hydrolase [Seinonella peptonophila]SHF13784.1 futalosine hydrolase [Seinonella peptonophila]
MAQHILVVTAVSAEQEAVLHGLGSASHIDVIVGGVGSFSTAVKTTRKLSEQSYDLVISAGIAGGFADRAPVGSVAVANRIIAAELGAESEASFLPIEELGFGSSVISMQDRILAPIIRKLHDSELVSQVGSILSVSTTTGTTNTATTLLQRYPDAIAEAMEGFGVAMAAHEFSIPVLEIRTISNVIGPRDRESWKIVEALNMLTSVSKLLAEVY